MKYILILRPFDRDERVDEIDRILELLIESRYGPGRYYQHFEAPCITPLADTVDFDLMPVGLFSLLGDYRLADPALDFALVNGTRPGIHKVTAAATSAIRHSPSTSVRGSPCSRRPYIHP